MPQEEPVIIVPYDSAWPQKFESEKKLLKKILGKWAMGGIHHVGSTSIPGISAKPVIDIMVGVADLEKAKACIQLLEKISYCYFPYKPAEMIWFCKPSPYKRTHHLHLVQVGSTRWSECLAFRDYLRKNKSVRTDYEKLKKNLAKKYQNNREAYTEAKTNFITGVLKRVDVF